MSPQPTPRLRGPHGQLVRRPSKQTAWGRRREWAVIGLAGLTYMALVLSPLWLQWLRGL